MWRRVHSLLALVSLLFVLVLSLTGVFLAAVPVADALAPHVQRADGLSVADVLAVVEEAFAEPDRIDRLPSGAVVLTAIGDDGPERHLIDIRTGGSLGRQDDNPVIVWVKELHRSFLLGSTGRLAAGITALAMAVICASGFALLLRRQGGWRGLVGPVRGGALERLHAISGRLSVLPLLFMAITGFYLTLVTFGVVSNGQETPPAIPESREELASVRPSQLHALAEIAFADVTSMVYPIPGDWFDVFSVTTFEGHIFVDQFTGDVLSSEPLRPAQKGLEWMKALHTGEGMAPLALLLGVSALSVPVFAFSGVAIWAQRRRRARSDLSTNADTADTIVLVGSENGSTWGFARHLQQKLTEAGRSVHLAPFKCIETYRSANAVLILTSTYGDGDAPGSASNALASLRAMRGRPNWRFAVLGFGDRSFANFSKFGIDVDDQLGTYADRLLPFASIDRENAQSFARWGVDLGRALDTALALDYVPPRPQTYRISLAERLEYGAATGTPTVLLRFDASGLPPCRPGDVVGIIADGTSVPRFYSPATGHPDGRLEICVRKLDGGHASGQLHELKLGDSIDAFVRTNDGFHAPNRPLILIAAGTGIAPFAGVIRGNVRKREIDLYWGGRDPVSDFLYRDGIDDWIAAGKLTSFKAAFSRIQKSRYVQHVVSDDGAALVARIEQGAVVMVCGSSEMAAGVRAAFDAMLAASGESVAGLKRKRRYLEEIY